MAHFVYKRKVTGKVDPETEKPTVIEFYDTLNLKKVIRTHCLTEDSVLVLLDDGHEVSDVQRSLIDPKKPPTGRNVVEVRSRIWIQSEIVISGEDVPRYYEALEKEV